MFPSRFRKETLLVNCFGFQYNSVVPISLYWSWDVLNMKKGLFDIMSGMFMSRELMIFIWSDLISSMLFSNFVLDLNFTASNMLFMSICSNCSSKDSGSSERWFSWTNICDWKWFDVSFLAVHYLLRITVFQRWK